MKKKQKNKQTNKQTKKMFFKSCSKVTCLLHFVTQLFVHAIDSCSRDSVQVSLIIIIIECSLFSSSRKIKMLSKYIELKVFHLVH